MILWLLGCSLKATPPQVEATLVSPIAEVLSAESAAVIAALDAAVAERTEAFGDPAVQDDPEWVARRLAYLVAIDQLIRKAFAPDGPRDLESAIAARMERVDTANTKELAALVAKHGWITRSAFGDEASRNAWLLVQHADQDRDFQRAMLATMAGLPVGEVRPKDVAYLSDRIASAELRPQRYGTQGRCTPAGWVPNTIEDPDNIDAVRASVGIEPMAEYVARFDCDGKEAPAEAAYRSGVYAECQALYEGLAAARAGVGASQALYNAACCAALAGAVDPAFSLLARAQQAGWNNPAHLADDPDLKSLHDDPRWAPLVGSTP